MILGPVGDNFGAGMTGGVAYVLDEDGTLPHRLNPDSIVVSPVDDEEDRELLRRLIARHRVETGSIRAAEILDDFDRWCARFRRIAGADAERLRLKAREAPAGVAAE